MSVNQAFTAVATFQCAKIKIPLMSLVIKPVPNITLLYGFDRWEREKSFPRRPIKRQKVEGASFDDDIIISRCGRVFLVKEHYDITLCFAAMQFVPYYSLDKLPNRGEAKVVTEMENSAVAKYITDCHIMKVNKSHCNQKLRKKHR